MGPRSRRMLEGEAGCGAGVPLSLILRDYDYGVPNSQSKLVGMPHTTYDHTQ